MRGVCVFRKNPLKSSSEHKTLQLTYFACEIMCYSGSWLAPKRQLLFSQCRDFSETSTLRKADSQTALWLSSTAHRSPFLFGNLKKKEKSSKFLFSAQLTAPTTGRVSE